MKKSPQWAIDAVQAAKDRMNAQGRSLIWEKHRLCALAILEEREIRCFSEERRQKAMKLIDDVWEV